jgi:hypothetical protein
MTKKTKDKGIGSVKATVVFTDTADLNENMNFPFKAHSSVKETIQYFISEYKKKGINDNEEGDIQAIEDCFSKTVIEVNLTRHPLGNEIEVLFNARTKEEKTDLSNRVKLLIGTHTFEKIINQLHPAFWYFVQERQNNLKKEKELEEKEAELNKREQEATNKHTKIAIHTVTQFYGDNKQLSLFSDEKIDAFSKATGLNITNRPDSYGVVLNQSQSRVFEGILKAFSDTNYKGDEQKDKGIALTEVYSDTETSGKTLVKSENAPYKNIDTIPVVRLTQAQIIHLSGYDLKSQRQGDKQDVIEALSFLATNQFCFYWVRLKTENGKPVKDKNGDYIKEETAEVGTLLRIKTVRDQTGLLQYYEIHPSAPLLDQVSNYFLLVPNNWREEVKQLTGKKASSYTYQLLGWLRLQYEQIRRYNSGKNRKKKPFKISKSWEDVAIALKMPETMYKANRKRASKIIKDAYSIAIKLGYLVKVENNGSTDILYLNESYYPKPGELV